MLFCNLMSYSFYKFWGIWINNVTRNLGVGFFVWYITVFRVICLKTGYYT